MQRIEPLTLIVALVVLGGRRAPVVLGGGRRAIVLIRGRAGGDVVDLDGVVPLEIVDGVNATAGLFLDGSTRFVFLLLTLLAAEPPRGRRRTEIRGAIPGGAGRTAGPRTKSATAPKAAAKATAKAPTRRTRPWRAARPKTTKAGRTRRPILARARFAHRQVPSLEWLRVELSDDLLGGGALREFGEGEPTRPAGLAIDRHDNVRRLRDRREVRPEIRFRRAVGQVADEEPDSQGSPEKAYRLYPRWQASTHAAIWQGWPGRPVVPALAFDPLRRV